MKILLAESDAVFCEALRECLRRKHIDIELVTVDRFGALMQALVQQQPDLVLLDTILPDADGLKALQHIRSLQTIRQPEIIVLSSYFSWALLQEVCAAHPLLFIMLPCDAAWLAERIRGCCREMVCSFPENCGDELSSIRHILREMGLNSRSKGFLYAQMAIRFLIKNPEPSSGLTKVLYPAVARACHTSSANVERAIRSAVMSAWQRSGFLRQQELFTVRPTNGEFLTVLAEQVKKNCTFTQEA